jgi:hypothetical protein
MSELIGRIRRVCTGWGATPGKNLLIFDDVVVLVSPSALDGTVTGAAAQLT